MKRNTKIALPASLVFITACIKKDNTPPVRATKGVILPNNATYGSIMPDSAGNTLYFFSPDASGASACSGKCTVAWPTYYTLNSTAHTGLIKTDFGTITRADGTPQTIYKGRPLYYFGSDEHCRDTRGVSHLLHLNNSYGRRQEGSIVILL